MLNSDAEILRQMKADLAKLKAKVDGIRGDGVTNSPNGIIIAQTQAKPSTSIATTPDKTIWARLLSPAGYDNRWNFKEVQWNALTQKWEDKESAATGVAINCDSGTARADAVVLLSMVTVSDGATPPVLTRSWGFHDEGLTALKITGYNDTTHWYSWKKQVATPTGYVDDNTLNADTTGLYAKEINNNYTVPNNAIVFATKLGINGNGNTVWGFEYQAETGIPVQLSNPVATGTYGYSYTVATLGGRVLATNFNAANLFGYVKTNPATWGFGIINGGSLAYVLAFESPANLGCS